jgi:hypothetical protein
MAVLYATSSATSNCHVFALSFLRCVRRGVAFSLVACFAASKVGPKRSGKEGQHAVLKVACSGLLFTPSSAFGCTQCFSFGLRSVRLEQRRHVHLVTLHGSLGIVISFT